MKLNFKKMLATGLLLASMSPAWADELNDSSRLYDLDEVVVVAQAKEFYRLRLQPLSSTVLAGKDLSRLGVRDLRDISDYVPSFVMPNYGSRFTSSIYVRGIGSRVNSPSMGVYVDDMPLMSKTAFNSHTYQLDRVDVLRGPQGTLYGMNTEGGMVRMYTKNPMNYQGTDINLGIGTGFYRNIEVSHYQKLSKNLAFSLAGFYNGQNGFYRNVTTDERADDGNEAGARMKLVFKPSSRLTFNVVGDYQFVKQKAYPYGVLTLEDGHVGEPSQDAQSRYKRNMFNTGLSVKLATNNFDFYANTSYQHLYDNLLMDNDYSEIDFIVVDQYQKQNAVTQEFTFKSNRPGRWHWTSGIFGAYTWLTTTAPNRFGTAFSSMMSKNIENMIYQPILKSMMDRGMSEEAARAAIERAGGVHLNMSLFVPCHFNTPQFNLGIFHESNVDITDHLVGTIGLRYDFTQSKIAYDTSGDSQIDFSIMGANGMAKVLSHFKHKEKATYNQLLPKFGLTYKLDNGSNFYATLTKGYRAGGFNVQMFGDIIQNDVQKNLQGVLMEAMQTRTDIEKVIQHSEEEYATLRDGIEFKPEESWNYELGTHLNLLNNKIHADFSLYYMQIRNQQLSIFTEDYGYGRKMVNAGKSYSCGLELSLNGSALDNHLTWATNYGYTMAKFQEYTTKESARGGNIDYKGKRVPFVPEHTFSAMADYRFDIAERGLRSLTLGANVNAMGRIFWDELNTFDQSLYAIAGAHLQADFGLATVKLWGRNLTDTKYNTFAFLSKATGRPIYSAQRGNPFQIGLDVKLHF